MNELAELAALFGAACVAAIVLAFILATQAGTSLSRFALPERVSALVAATWPTATIVDGEYDPDFGFVLKLLHRSGAETELGIRLSNRNQAAWIYDLQYPWDRIRRFSLDTASLPGAAQPLNEGLIARGLTRTVEGDTDTHVRCTAWRPEKPSSARHVVIELRDPKLATIWRAQSELGEGLDVADEVEELLRLFPPPGKGGSRTRTSSP